MAIQELFDFETFPTLDTERLRLREITPHDVEAIFRIRGDYEVTRYNVGPAYSRLEQASALIANLRSAFDDKRTIRWGITLKDEDIVIGMCGYNYWIRTDYRGSIGYDLARAYWGRGIMPEAIHAIVEFGFTRMGLNRIEADATVHNLSSIRVLEKVGFGREGIQREQYFEEGTFYDLMLFSLLRRDYLNEETIVDDLLAHIQTIVDAAQTLLSGAYGVLGNQHSDDMNAILSTAYQLYDLVNETSDDRLPYAAADMNSLLMSILGFSQLMLEYPETYDNVQLNTGQRSSVRQISASSEYMLVVLESLNG